MIDVNRTSSNNQVRIYNRSNCVSFLKTTEKYGGLSNMASGFPVVVNHIQIRSIEALYQACRFPNNPEVQRLIIEQHSPINAKMQSKHYVSNTRTDWNHVRVSIMRWCLRVKLVQNWNKFGDLLLSTGNLPIVEVSYKSDFWGAKPTEKNLLTGMNVLGRLLMELREEIISKKQQGFTQVEPIKLSDFLLFGKGIEPVKLLIVNEEPTKKIVVNQNENKNKQRKSHQENLFNLYNFDNSRKSITKHEINDISTIKQYPIYKDTGIPWIGKIPSHWNVVPNRALFREIIDQNHVDEPLLSVTISRGIIQQLDLLSDTSKKDSSNLDKSKYKLVLPNDIAYNKMRAWQGAIGVSRYRGIVSPAYIVVQLRRQNNPKYFHHLFRTPGFAKEAERWSYGITSDQWSLRSEHFRMIYSCVPPLEEQNDIVRYLDYMDHLVKRFIRAKQKEIKLLNEQKQIIIQQAVTRGLNPNIHFKPSRVEWLGNIPEHWQVLAMKNAFYSIDYGISEPSTDEGNIPVLTMGNVKDGMVTEAVAGGVSSVDPKLLLKEGDLLFNRTNSAELVGKVGLFFGSPIETTFASYLVRLRTNQKSDPLFMNYLLNSPSILDLAHRFAIPSLHQSNLNPTRYTRLLIALPPIDEQRDIVSFLKNKIGPLLVSINSINRQIERIKEYRTRLIADVVTGKVDVREANARIPQKLEVLDPDEELHDEESPENAEDEQAEGEE